MPEYVKAKMFLTETSKTKSEGKPQHHEVVSMIDLRKVENGPLLELVGKNKQENDRHFLFDELSCSYMHQNKKGQSLVSILPEDVLTAIETEINISKIAMFDPYRRYVLAQALIEEFLNHFLDDVVRMPMIIWFEY